MLIILSVLSVHVTEALGIGVQVPQTRSCVPDGGVISYSSELQLVYGVHVSDVVNFESFSLHVLTM